VYSMSPDLILRNFYLWDILNDKVTAITLALKTTGKQAFKLQRFFIFTTEIQRADDNMFY